MSPIQLRGPAALTVLRQGEGFRQAGGSTAVRDIQRRLRALGYRPGPVDGVYGPWTQSSVAWFQIKHRLPPTGAVDGGTLNLLRFRTHGLPAASPDLAEATVKLAPRSEAAFVPAPLAPAAHAAPALPRLTPVARPRPRHHETAAALVMLLLGLALALIVVASITTWLRSDARIPVRELLRRLAAQHAQAARVPARPSAPRRGRVSNRAAAVRASGERRVIGYAAGRSDRDFARQQRAIERICAERDWTLSALVKERDGARRKQRRPPGLSHVLRQVAAGGVAQLVVGRLASLARTPAELAVLLEWCGRRDVGLVALDVGLDTTTADGRLAARCLGAMGPAAASAGRTDGNGQAKPSGVR